MTDERKKRILLGTAIIAAIALFAVHPNPFGNDPDVIADETFLTGSALSAIAHKTLPGFDFSNVGGAYYGGPEIYASFFLVSGGAVAITPFAGSWPKALAFISWHIGDVLGLVRTFILLIRLGLLGFLSWFALSRDSVPRETKRSYLLLILLLFGSSLFVSLFQTAKVWSLQVAFDLAAAGIVCLEEDARARGGWFLRPGTREADLLLWLSVAAFAQNFLPGLLTFFWIAAALFLRHFGWRDVLAALKRWWLALLAVLALQASVMVRFAATMVHDGKLTTRTMTAFTRPDGSYDLLMQMRWPLRTLMQTQPLILPGILVVIGLSFILGRRGDLRRRFSLVLMAYPAAVWLADHLVYRLGGFIRYVLPLTVAAAVSLAFLPKPKKAQTVLFVAAGLLAALVTGKMLLLEWRPSSERLVADFFKSRPSSVIVNDQARTSFILRHETGATVIDADASGRLTPEQSALVRSATSVWEVRPGCQDRCTEAESTDGCRFFNAKTCTSDGGYVLSQDGMTLGTLMSVDHLGYPYVARKLTAGR